MLKKGVGLMPTTQRWPSAETSRVHIKVVAHGELAHQRMQIRRDLEMSRGLQFLGPAVHAVAGQRRIAVGAGHVAQHLVVGAVLAHHQEAVLEPGQRRPDDRWRRCWRR